MTCTFDRGAGALIAALLTILLTLSVAIPAAAAAPDTRAAYELGRFRDVSDFGDFSSPLNQSLAILALARADGVAPSDEAIAVLLAQQCDDGGFPTTFRSPTTADPAPCAPSVDTTAFAVQALAAVGRGDAVDAAVDWLLTAQVGAGDDAGSFGSPDGLNVNSTGLAAVALDIGGETAAADDARAWILGVQEGCDSQRPGAIPFNADEDGNVELATAQAVIGLRSGDLRTLTAAGATDTSPANGCDDAEGPELGDPAEAAAAYLVDQLEDGAFLEGDFGPQPGFTIDVLFALASLDDIAGDEIAAIASWLDTQVAGYTQGVPFDGEDARYAGATAKLALGTIVAGQDPTDVGGTDLIAQLRALESTELPEVSLACDADEVAPGDEVGCKLSGLIPNETVTVRVELNPTLLDEPTPADDSGEASFAFVLPDDATDGDTVTITVDGLGTDGLAGASLAVVITEVEEVDDVPTDDTVDDAVDDGAEEDEDIIPETGAGAGLATALGVLCLLLGAVLLGVTRRRRETEPA